MIAKARIFAGMCLSMAVLGCTQTKPVEKVADTMPTMSTPDKIAAAKEELMKKPGTVVGDIQAVDGMYVAVMGVDANAFMMGDVIHIYDAGMGDTIAFASFKETTAAGVVVLKVETGGKRAPMMGDLAVKLGK